MNLIHELVLLLDQNYPDLINAINHRLDSGGTIRMSFNFQKSRASSGGKPYRRFDRKKIGSIPGADVYAFTLEFSPDQENNADFEVSMVLEKLGNVLSDADRGLIATMTRQPIVAFPERNSTFLRLLNRLGIRPLDSLPLERPGSPMKIGYYSPASNKVVYNLLVTQNRAQLPLFTKRILKNCSEGEKATVWWGLDDVLDRPLNQEEIKSLQRFTAVFMDIFEAAQPFVHEIWEQLAGVGRNIPLWADLKSYYGRAMDQQRVFDQKGLSVDDYVEQWDKGNPAEYFKVFEKTFLFEEHGDSQACLMLFLFLAQVEEKLGIQLLSSFEFDVSCFICGHSYTTECIRSFPSSECPKCSGGEIIFKDRRKCQ
ncbi:MAG: hypothetical protein ACXACI_06665 [Candidatus Hodarchaeales archaeon]